MTDKDPIADASLYLVASNPALMATGCKLWNERLADWLLWSAVNRADSSFGKYAWLSTANDLAEARAAEKFGRQFETNPLALSEVEPTRAALKQYEDAVIEQFDRPLWKAAVVLAQTPAPNIAAALFKIQLIRREDLDCDATMERDAFDIVKEDMARLRAPAPADPVTRHAEAEHAFGNGEISEDSYLAAHEALKNWQPPSLTDFARKFVALFDNGGSPVAETRTMLVREARYLIDRTVANCL